MVQNAGCVLKNGQKAKRARGGKGANRLLFGLNFR